VNLSTQELHSIAEELHEAERRRVPVESLTARFPTFDEESAYMVQNMNAARGTREGKRLVGYKVGLTSREAQRHFKVFKPDFGHLFDSMAVLEESQIAPDTLIQPKIEGEIAFLLGRDLQGPGITVADAARAVDGVMVCLEIIDSRIRDWKIAAPDTIADNGSSALFVLSGSPRLLSGLDLTTTGMAFSCNGEVMVTGAASAVMGNPLSALVFLANELGKHQKGLLAGEVVLSGSPAGMLPARAENYYSCEMLGLGRVAVRFGKGNTQ